VITACSVSESTADFRIGETRRRRHFLHLGEAERLEQADVHPTQVDLVPLVESFAEVAYAWWLLCSSSPPMIMPQGTMFVARILGRPVTVPPEMSDAVDDARRPERDPGDLRNEDQSTRTMPKQHDVDSAHQGDAQYRETGVDVALEPVVGCAVAVAGHRLAV